MHDEFKAQVAASAVLKNRFETIYNFIADDVETDTGVRPTPEDVIPMACVRTAVFADSDDWTAWRDESALIPAIAKAKERQRLQDALQADGDSPEARGITDRLASMGGAERLAWARANNVATPAKKQADARGEGQTVKERAALVRQAESMHGGARIGFARKHGLL